MNKFIHKLAGGDSEEKKLEQESEDYARQRIELFAGQPEENKEPIVSYDSRIDFDDPFGSKSASFDLANISEGTVLRINMGGYDPSNPSIIREENKIHIYIVAGKRDSKGLLRLYEVRINNSDADLQAQFEPNLKLSPHGFSLQRLNYKISDPKYSGTEFPIYRAKDYFRLVNQDWPMGAEIPGNQNPINILWPDEYIPNGIDIMVAGERSKGPKTDNAKRGETTHKAMLRRNSGLPVPS